MDLILNIRAKFSRIYVKTHKNIYHRGAKFCRRGLAAVSPFEFETGSGRIGFEFLFNESGSGPISVTSLISTGVSSTKSPPGHSHTDVKRPDGLTLNLWSSEKRAVWDVTVINYTFANSFLRKLHPFPVLDLN